MRLFSDTHFFDTLARGDLMQLHNKSALKFLPLLKFPTLFTSLKIGFLKAPLANSVDLS